MRTNLDPRFLVTSTDRAPFSTEFLKKNPPESVAKGALADQALPPKLCLPKI